MGPLQLIMRAADRLRRGAGRGIFHTARSVAISGFGLSLFAPLEYGIGQEEQDGLLLELLFPVTGPLTEVVLDTCLSSNGSEYARDVRTLALQLQRLITAREAVFAFEMTGFVTRRLALAWRWWPRTGTREHDAAAAAHAHTRAWPGRIRAEGQRHLVLAYFPDQCRLAIGQILVLAQVQRSTVLL